MEVDNEYKWVEEASYKPVDGPLPVSKRQQKKGLGPSVYILAFNSIEALEKNYLAQSPSHSLTDPILRQEGGGVEQNHGRQTHDEKQTLRPSLEY